jgi:hypothetical protein
MRIARQLEQREHRPAALSPVVSILVTSDLLQQPQVAVRPVNSAKRHLAAPLRVQALRPLAVFQMADLADGHPAGDQLVAHGSNVCDHQVHSPLRVRRRGRQRPVTYAQPGAEADRADRPWRSHQDDPRAPSPADRRPPARSPRPGCRSPRSETGISTSSSSQSTVMLFFSRVAQSKGGHPITRGHSLRARSGIRFPYEIPVGGSTGISTRRTTQSASSQAVGHAHRIGNPHALVSDFVPLSEQHFADEHAVDRTSMRPVNIRHSADPVVGDGGRSSHCVLRDGFRRRRASAFREVCQPVPRGARRHRRAALRGG